MENRDIDLVIKNEEDMMKLIALITISIQTLDNKKGSAFPTLKLLDFPDQKRLYQNTMLKYKILKWRAKISFMALRKSMTIQEMFFR